jgi:hypothetical protein
VLDSVAVTDSNFELKSIWSYLKRMKNTNFMIDNFRKFGIFSSVSDENLREMNWGVRNKYLSQKNIFLYYLSPLRGFLPRWRPANTISPLTAMSPSNKLQRFAVLTAPNVRIGPGRHLYCHTAGRHLYCHTELSSNYFSVYETRKLMPNPGVIPWSSQFGLFAFHSAL